MCWCRGAIWMRNRAQLLVCRGKEWQQRLWSRTMKEIFDWAYNFSHFLAGIDKYWRWKMSDWQLTHPVNAGPWWPWWCFTKRLHWWIQLSGNWRFVCKINVMLTDGNRICRPMKLHRKGSVKAWTGATNSADPRGKGREGEVPARSWNTSSIKLCLLRFKCGEKATNAGMSERNRALPLPQV